VANKGFFFQPEASFEVSKKWLISWESPFEFESNAKLRVGAFCGTWNDGECQLEVDSTGKEALLETRRPFLARIGDPVAIKASKGLVFCKLSGVEKEE